MEKVDFVIVAYKEELTMLRLQARSFSKFVPRNIIGNIYIVINDSNSNFCFHYVYRNVLPEFGNLASCVRIMETRTFAPGVQNKSGYVSQQIAKLKACDIVESPLYITLDAKNFFIKPVSLSLFFDNGIPRSYIENYEAEFQVSMINECYRYWGTGEEKRTYRLPAMMTPFIMYGNVAKNIIKEMENKSGEDFVNAFSKSFQVHSEFILYSTFIVNCGDEIDSVYRPSPSMSITLWGGCWSGENAFSGVLEYAKNSDAFMIGLHRKRIAQMNSVEHQDLRIFLSRIGLFEEEDGFNIQATCQ